jgi:hypothetical protein
MSKKIPVRWKHSTPAKLRWLIRNEELDIKGDRTKRKRINILNRFTQRPIMKLYENHYYSITQIKTETHTDEEIIEL